MRTTLVLFSFLSTLLTVPAFASGDACEALAKEIVAVATKGRAPGQFVTSIFLDVENPASGSVEKVQRVLFETGASEITVDTLPDYYSKGQCELKSVKIDRE